MEETAFVHGGSASSGDAPREENTRPNARRTRQHPQQMQMTIDSQSFVNLGQLMGTRGSDSVMAGTGSGSGGASAATGGEGLGSYNVDVASSSFLCQDSDSESEELKDFDQIFHPTESASSAWLGRELCSDDEDAPEEEGEDDDDSVLPALPSPSPGSGSPTGSCLSRSGSNNSRRFNTDESLEHFTVSAGLLDTLGGSDGIFVAGNDHPDKGGARYSGVSPSRNDNGSDDGGARCEKFPAAADTPETQRGSFDDSYSSQPLALSDNAKTAKSNHQTKPSQFEPEADAAAVAAPSGGDVDTPADQANSSSTSFLRESWLHVPLDCTYDGDDRVAEESTENKSGRKEDGAASPNAGVMDEAKEEYPPCSAAAAIGAGARRAAGAVGDCGDCVVCGVEKAAAYVGPQLKQLAQLAKEQVEAGAEACVKGQKRVVKAVDNVPQAPVRVWLGRMAGSLVLGAILGGAAAYYNVPRAITASVTSCASADATSPPWYDKASGRGAGEPSAAATEQSFGERLNKALFAARAGEAAAQQDLLEEVRNILAATGKSGGISAEQILRQFNAKRFAEASKAWSAAESLPAGTEYLDPLFFSPPSAPTYRANASPSPHQYKQQQQQQHQHSSASRGSVPRSECASGSSCFADNTAGGAGHGSSGGSSRTIPRGFHEMRGGGGGVGGSGEGVAGSSRPFHRRPCAGGWVC